MKFDTFICHAPEEEGKKGHGVSRSLFLSKFSAVKQVCFSAVRKSGTENLEPMLESLEITITAASKLIIFLRNYPPMFWQPYSMYL